MSLSGAQINKIRSEKAKFATPKNKFLKKLLEDKKNFDLKSVPNKLKKNINLDTWSFEEIDSEFKEICIEYFGLSRFSLSSVAEEKFSLAEEIIFPEVEICIKHLLSVKDVEDYLTNFCS